MNTDPTHPGNDDPLDPGLVRQFNELQEIPAPDIWDQAAAPRARQTRFLGPRFGLQIAAAVVVVAGFVALVMTGPATNVVDTSDAGPSITATVGQTSVAPGVEDGQARPLQAVTSGDAAVVDLRLVDGTRFRLSVPERFSAGLVYAEPGDSGPVSVEGDDITIEIRYGFCADEDSMVLNAQGSAVSQNDGVVEVCRADEVLTMTATVGDELSAEEFDSFDVRPVGVAGSYSVALVRVWPNLANCGNCAPWGPMVFPEQNTVVNRTGPTTVTAVDLDSLVQVWSVDTGGFDTYLHGGPGGVFLEVTGGPLLKLNAATGEQEWALERDPEERDLSLSVLRSGAGLVQTSFTTEGSERPPLLRRVDLDTGQEVWSTTGAARTSWHQSPPASIDNLVVMAGVSEDTPTAEPPSAASTVWAFDVATGDTAWSTDLADSVDGSHDDAVLVLSTEAGSVLIVRTSDTVARLDAATGNTMWTVQAPGVVIDGTDLTREGRIGISMTTMNSRVVLDPANGQTLTPLEDQLAAECPVTRPTEPSFVPPAPWPQTPNSDDFAWFGTADLWTVIDRDGHTPRKSVWWSANFPGGATEEQPELSITYERLDADDKPIVSPSPGTNGSDANGDFMINGIEPATTGCWIATGTYKGHSLSYIYEVT